MIPVAPAAPMAPIPPVANSASGALATGPAARTCSSWRRNSSAVAPAPLLRLRSAPLQQRHEDLRPLIALRVEARDEQRGERVRRRCTPPCFP